MNTLDKLRETERRICANIDKHKEGTPEYDEVREGLSEAYERVRWMIEAAGELYDALNAVMPIVLMHAPSSAEGLKAMRALRLAKKGKK